MAVLVTGAAGFVGSAVVRTLLAQGATVRAFVRPTSDRGNLADLPVELAFGDLRDRPSLDRAVKGCEAVFHVAADYRLWVPRPSEMFESNVCRELEDEAGLTRADIRDLRMLGLCREFLRGGKPQIFFSAVTDLSATELSERRRRAIDAQIRRGRQEILDEVLEEVNPATLVECTLECRANLTLA